MEKIKKVFNIITIIAAVVLFFTTTVYSYSFQKDALRLEIGRADDTLYRIGESYKVIPGPAYHERRNDVSVQRNANVYPKKILLVYLVEDGSSLDFPIGVYTLKNYLEHNYPGQCVVEVKDVQLDKIEDIINFAVDWKPHMIGLSLMVGASGKLEEFTSKLVSRIPQEEQPLLAVGKNISTFAPSELLKKHPEIICVRGEGELPIGGLLEYLEGKKELDAIPNIAYLNGDNMVETPRKLLTDFQHIGKVDYSFAQQYVSRGGNVWIETSRGCPWGHCTFCSTRAFWGTAVWRAKPIDTIVEELKDIERLGVNRVTFTDEEFFGYDMNGVDRAREIALAIIKSGVKISFYLNARADAIYNKNDNPEDREKRIETLKLLKQAGLDIIYLGIESGSVSQLKRYAKGMDIIEAESAIKICKELGIEMAIGWIMFEPLVTLEEISESIDFIKRNKILQYISTPLNQLRMYPAIPYVQLVKVEERKTGKKLISSEFDAGSLTFRTIGYADQRVEAISELIEKYSKGEYDVYNALKWFVRFNPNANSKEFRYLKDVLELFKEYQIDFLHELTMLSKEDLATGRVSMELFTKAVDKRTELIMRTAQMINENGHEASYRGVMRKINAYLAAILNSETEDELNFAPSMYQSL